MRCKATITGQKLCIFGLIVLQSDTFSFSQPLTTCDYHQKFCWSVTWGLLVFFSLITSHKTQTKRVIIICFFFCFFFWSRQSAAFEKSRGNNWFLKVFEKLAVNKKKTILGFSLIQPNKSNLTFRPSGSALSMTVKSQRWHNMFCF